nr:predicted GPI-anchored protein 58 [Aegilops tauschii subsp. strangulata]
MTWKTSYHPLLAIPRPTIHLKKRRKKKPPHETLPSHSSSPSFLLPAASLSLPDPERPPHPNPSLPSPAAAPGLLPSRCTRTSLLPSRCTRTSLALHQNLLPSGGVRDSRARWWRRSSSAASAGTPPTRTARCATPAAATAACASPTTTTRSAGSKPVANPCVRCAGTRSPAPASHSRRTVPSAQTTGHVCAAASSPCCTSFGFPCGYEMALTRIGLATLALMGQNLALNIAENGFPVSVYNRMTSKVDETVQRAKLERLPHLCLQHF